MHLRNCTDSDVPRLIELAIETFRPFYVDYVHPLLGDDVFDHQHGQWIHDYYLRVPSLLEPTAGRFMAIAEVDDAVAGFVAWGPGERALSGQIEMLAVSTAFRRQQIGRTLCLYALDALRRDGVEVVGVGTGDDAFHSAARSLYEDLGFTKIPIAGYLMKV